MLDRAVLRTLPLGLPVLLAACVNPRAAADPVAALAPPATWAAAPSEPGPDAPGTGDWWTSFGDPGLDAAVEEARGANWDLAGAGHRVAAAAAEARIAAGSRWPALDAGLDLSRSRRNFIGLPVPGAEGGVLAVESESHALSIQLSWEADLWGRLDAAERAAIGAWQAAEADWHGARLSLTGMVAKAWFALSAAETRVGLAREEAQRQGELLTIQRGHFRSGQGGAAAIHQLQADLASAEERLRRSQQELAASARALELLLSRYPAGETRNPGLPALPPPVPAGLPAALVDRRPDLAAAGARLRRELALADQAEASLYPRLSLTASGGTSTAALSDLLDGDFKVWSLAAGLTAPLFHGGQLRAGLEAREAGAEAARAGFLQATLVAFEEVEGALAAEQALRARLDLADQALAAAAAAAPAPERRLPPRRATAPELIAAREGLRLARAARLEVQLALLLNRVDLHLALGGGFAPQSR